MPTSGKHGKPSDVSPSHGADAANPDGLTCSEGQVEDLLSEGESTESKRATTIRTRKAAAKKPSL
jgi:hypothetical protein